MSAKSKKKNDKQSLQQESIKVLIRFRPINSSEKRLDRGAHYDKKSEISYLARNQIQLINRNGKKYKYGFDTIMTATTTQRQAFEAVAEQTCDEILQGYNGTIFVYGQSGSGKTHTMYGPEDEKDEMDITSFGIIPMSCAYIFTILNDNTHPLSEDIINYNVRCEFIEIYNEKLRDLLNPKQIPQIREILINKKYIPVMKNITTKPVSNLEECISAIRIATSNRTIAHTNLNATSSRSHMVFRLIVTIETKNGIKKTGIGNFADLAGSEKVKKTGVKGKQLKEAGNILKSLSALSNVIDSLEKGKKHIPFKDSKLTFMLKNSLGGNCKTTLLICASPHIHNRDETIRSIQFGMRCRNVQNVVCINQVTTKQQLIRENDKLKNEINLLKSNAINAQEIISEKLNDVEIENFNLSEQIESNEKNISILTQQLQQMNIEKDEILQREKTLIQEFEILQESYRELKMNLNHKKTLDTMAEYEEEIEHYKRKVTDLDINYEDITNENTKLKIKCNELDAIINRLKDELSIKTDQYQSFKIKYQNIENEIISLQSKLSFDKNNENISLKLTQDIQHLNIQFNKEKKQNENLKSQLKEYENKNKILSTEKYKIEDENRTLKEEYNSLKNKFNRFQSDVNIENNKYDKNIINLKSQIDIQREKILKLSNNIKLFQDQKYETQIDKLETKIEEQSNDIKILIAEKKDLNHQIKQLQLEKDKLISEKEASPSLSQSVDTIDSEHDDDDDDDDDDDCNDDDCNDDDDEKKEEEQQQEWDAILDSFHPRTRSSAFVRNIPRLAGSDKVIIKFDDDGDAEELDKLEAQNKTNGIEKYTRKKRKKYKKRNLSKQTFDAADPSHNAQKLKKLLSPRNPRKMSRADAIVRRQTIALGNYFDHHLKKQKEKDEKMEKVFDAMEQRRISMKRKDSNKDKIKDKIKDKVKDINDNNNNHNNNNINAKPIVLMKWDSINSQNSDNSNDRDKNKENIKKKKKSSAAMDEIEGVVDSDPVLFNIENKHKQKQRHNKSVQINGDQSSTDHKFAQKLQQQQLDLYQQAWFVHGYDEYMRQKSLHQYEIQHQIKNKHRNRQNNHSASSQSSLQSMFSNNNNNYYFPPPSQHINHPIYRGNKSQSQHSSSISSITPNTNNPYLYKNQSIYSNHSKSKSEKKHRRRKSNKSKAIKAEESAKLALIYDNEYKAMKRRYQQKKRKRFLSKANMIQPSNYSIESSATVVYDSDYNQIDSENIPLFD